MRPALICGTCTSHGGLSWVNAIPMAHLRDSTRRLALGHNSRERRYLHRNVRRHPQGPPSTIFLTKHSKHRRVHAEQHTKVSVVSEPRTGSRRGEAHSLLQTQSPDTPPLTLAFPRTLSCGLLHLAHASSRSWTFMSNQERAAQWQWIHKSQMIWARSCVHWRSCAPGTGSSRILTNSASMSGPV
jgi:hypothetical protein